jgi:hypothetical protein
MNSASPTSESELVTEPPAIGDSSNISSSVVIVHRNADTSDDDSLLQMEADTSEDESLLPREANIPVDEVLQRKADLHEEKVMKWQGFATKGISNRSNPSLYLQEGHHQATGLRKSTCFQIPALMLTNREVGLVIFLTFSLGMDHCEAFTE